MAKDMVRVVIVNKDEVTGMLWDDLMREPGKEALLWGSYGVLTAVIDTDADDVTLSRLEFYRQGTDDRAVLIIAGSLLPSKLSQQTIIYLEGAAWEQWGEDQMRE